MKKKKQNYVKNNFKNEEKSSPLKVNKKMQEPRFQNIRRKKIWFYCTERISTCFEGFNSTTFYQN